MFPAQLCPEHTGLIIAKTRGFAIYPAKRKHSQTKWWQTSCIDMVMGSNLVINFRSVYRNHVLFQRNEYLEGNK